jgi:hypothetical protein
VTPAPLLLEALRRPAQLDRYSLADWDTLLRQAGAANLLAHLYHQAERHGLLQRVPAPARTHLGWAGTTARRHARAARWEVRLIRQALADLDAPLILLKGAAYTMAELPCGAGRMYSDIDILLPKEMLPGAEGLLLLNGWVSTHLDEYDQRYYRQWMHELPPMMHTQRQTAIDVHHAILPLTAPVHPDPALLRAAAVPVPGHPGVLVLAPADMVLHSATHLLFDGELEHGTRDLADLDALLRHFGATPGFWDALVPRARQLELQRPLFYALRYCTLLLHTPVPEAVRADAAAGGPNRLLLALMDRLFGRALLPAHPSCADRWTPAARFLLYIRANWLRMPPLLLARHLFHKAFLSRRPKEDSADNEAAAP